MIKLILLFLMASMALSEFSVAQAKKSSKISFKPAVIYRSSFLTLRKESSFNQELKGRRTYADQIYLSLKVSRQYKFINKIVFEPSFSTERTNPNTTINRIDQGYIETYFGKKFKFVAGKRADYSGNGFFVNPSDLINENKSLYDDLKLREGKFMLRLNYLHGDWNLGLGFLPLLANDLEDAKGYAEVRTNLWDTEMGLAYSFNRKYESTVGFSVSRFFWDLFDIHIDGRYETKSHLDNISANARITSVSNRPAGVEAKSEDDGSLYFAGGTRFIFSPKRTLVVEYILNQAGLNQAEAAFYLENLINPGEDPEDFLIGRSYAALSYQDEDTLNKWTLGAGVIHNLEDQSTLASFSSEYSATPHIKISVAPSFYIGDRFSEFGELPFKTAVFATFKGSF